MNFIEILYDMKKTIILSTNKIERVEAPKPHINPTKPRSHQLVTTL